MAEIILNNDNFDSVVSEKGKLILIDFYADWCGPCAMLAPVLREIADEHEDIITLCKVNVDENQELAGKFQVAGIPTVIIFHNGIHVDDFVGYRDKTDILKIIEKFI